MAGADSPIFDLCLNGTSFPDVASFDNGHGYNEDWLWKKCLLMYAPDTLFINSPSLHVSTPVEQWADWQAGDTVAHVPSSFHWVKDSRTIHKLHSCAGETKHDVIQSRGIRSVLVQDNFPKIGCDCFILGFASSRKVTFCDLGRLYLSGFSACESFCTFFPVASFNGGRDACVRIENTMTGPIAVDKSAAADNFACPPLPIVNGVPTGAYFTCNYPLDWACFGATAQNLAVRLSTPDFPLLYDRACFDLDVHPRVFFCGGHGVQGHAMYNESDVRIIINAESEGMVASAPGGLYDLGVTGITRVPFLELSNLGEAAGIQVYLPFVTFGVLQNEGLSEMDLMLSPPAIEGTGDRPYFAAYASTHCGVPIRNKIYELLEKYRPVHILNKNCHAGLQAPPEGVLSDRRDEQAWMTTVVKRFSLYKFALVFENRIVPGYLTEKLANAKKAGSVPVYWGAVAAREIFNPAAFVDCSPLGNESQEIALSRCVNEVQLLDRNDTAWKAMVTQPFMLSGLPIDYKPLGAVVRGILECKRLGGCGELEKKLRLEPVCNSILASPLLRQAYFVPQKFGGCSSS